MMKQEINEHISLNNVSPTNYSENNSIPVITVDEFYSGHEEFLILEVQRHRYLWDSSMVEYRSKELRKMAWSAIAKKLGTSVELCRKKWIQLRGTFSKLKARFERDKQVPAWKYYNMLTFLSNFIAHKCLDDINMLESNISLNSNLLGDIPPFLDDVSFHQQSAQLNNNNSNVDLDSDIIIPNTSNNNNQQQQHNNHHQQQQQHHHHHQQHSSSSLLQEERRHQLFSSSNLIDSSSLLTPASKRQKMMIEDNNNMMMNREMIKDLMNEDVLFGKSIGKSLQNYPRSMRTKIKIEILEAFRKADESLELMNHQNNNNNQQNMNNNGNNNMINNKSSCEMIHSDDHHQSLS